MITHHVEFVCWSRFTLNILLCPGKLTQVDFDARGVFNSKPGWGTSISNFINLGMAPKPRASPGARSAAWRSTQNWPTHFDAFCCSFLRCVKDLDQHGNHMQVRQRLKVLVKCSMGAATALL